MSATYPMDMVRGRITVQVLSFFFLSSPYFTCFWPEMLLEMHRIKILVIATSGKKGFYRSVLMFFVVLIQQ